MLRWTCGPVLHLSHLKQVNGSKNFGFDGVKLELPVRKTVLGGEEVGLAFDVTKQAEVYMQPNTLMTFFVFFFFFFV